MSYRSLLVHLDLDATCPDRIRTAVRLARDMDCHLVGVAPVDMLDLPASPVAATALSAYANLAVDSLRREAEQSTVNFRHACQAAGLRSFETFVMFSGRAEVLLQQARCSDLLLMTQPDPRAPGYRWARERVEEVVLHNARPTLLLPYAGRFDTLGAEVLIAWDDSREAARAVHDALPLLRAARHVQTISWVKPGTGGDESVRARLDVLQAWLLRHGVRTGVRVESTPMPIAETLLSCAADLGSDLIVMGAYGHARWAERLMGGATRGLLDAMTVPVLMSH